MINLDARPDDSGPGSPSLSRRELLGLLATTGAGAMLAPIIRSGAVLAAETPKKGGQIVVALSQEPTVFNPNRPHIEVDRGVRRLPLLGQDHRLAAALQVRGQELAQKERRQ